VLAEHAAAERAGDHQPVARADAADGERNAELVGKRTHALVKLLRQDLCAGAGKGNADECSNRPAAVTMG
jgi:hypothetical protein